MSEREGPGSIEDSYRRVIDSQRTPPKQRAERCSTFDDPNWHIRPWVMPFCRDASFAKTEGFFY